MNTATIGQPFRLLRHFSIAALASIGIAALALSYLYRQLAVADLVRMGETHNVSQARILASSITPEFGQFLRAAADQDGDALRAHPDTKRLHEMLVDRVRGTTILKLKIYSLSGRTIYSSEARQIGEEKGSNLGFQAARSGQPASELTHRNTFSAFEQVVEQRGVLSSYVPMRNAAGAMEGVFELYDDITAMTELLDRTQVRVSLVAAAVLLTLFGALFAIVLRADRLIKAQHEAHEAHESELESRIAQRTQALERALDASEAASKAKSQFLANMSHEIRTPLNGLLGMAELLGGTALNAEQRRYCSTIASSGRALRDLLGDVLDLTKIEAGKLEFESEEFDLTRMLADLALLYRELASAHGSAFEFDSGLPPHLHLRGDSMRLRQVLSNLLGNAVKFTDRGRIRLAVQALDGRPGDARRWVRFLVEDSGIGMGQDTLSKLFQPFEQADTSTTRRYGGTGLGLAIARRLTVGMGGEIAVQSAEGSGTQFRIEIPFDAAPVSTGPSSTADHLQPSGTALSVLLVEDNEVNQQVARAMLVAAGHRVTVALNGVEAIGKCAADSYDCVLMDCQMPVMDGFEATRRIRAGDAGAGAARVPIVALTANAMIGDRERCLDAGMDDFLSKPFDRAVLLAAIVRNVGRGAAAGRPAEVGSPAPVPASFDPSALEELLSLEKDAPGFMAQLTASFLESTPLLIAEVSGVSQETVEEAQRAAHSLKSTGARFGAMALSAMAARAEAAARAGDLATTQALGVAMDAEFERAVALLQHAVLVPKGG